jgi:hypothetical protein
LNKIIFLLDEFPVLGHFPFFSKTMGILAGYGITFYIVVQALNQIIDIYGQNHTFLDNCKTVMVYAPGKIEDAKMFTEMIGKESVVKESISTSGTRYAASLNNINESSQEVARELMNPDELMKLPPTEALILNQGMPPYLAKKVVYYMDKRFKDNAYSVRKLRKAPRIPLLTLKMGKKDLFISLPNPVAPKVTVTRQTGFAPPATRSALLAGIRDPRWGLPSQKQKPLRVGGEAAQTRAGTVRMQPRTGTAQKTAPMRGSDKPDNAAHPSAIRPEPAAQAPAKVDEQALAQQLNTLLNDNQTQAVPEAAVSLSAAAPGADWSKRPDAEDREAWRPWFKPSLPPLNAPLPLTSDAAGEGGTSAADLSHSTEGGLP